MRIGFVQFSPALGDLPSTIHDLDELSTEFATADLVVLPELCNSGYNFASVDQARSSAEDAQEGPFVQYLLELCRRHNLYIVSGINELDEGKGHLYNTAVLVGPNGPVGKYRKLHLFLKEKDIFHPGDLGLPVFDLGRCKVGMLICFDWIFPEAWRVLALKGADVICHPSNLILPGLAQRAIPVHAVMSRIFVITSNRIGKEGSLQFTGLSTIANPKGEVLAQASETEPAVRIVEVDLDMAKDKMITPRNHVLTDRRPEDYSILVKPYI